MVEVMPWPRPERKIELHDGALTVRTILTKHPAWSGLISINYDDGSGHTMHIHMMKGEAESLIAMLTQMIGEMEEAEE